METPEQCPSSLTERQHRKPELGRSSGLVQGRRQLKELQFGSVQISSRLSGIGRSDVTRPPSDARLLFFWLPHGLEDMDAATRMRSIARNHERYPRAVGGRNLLAFGTGSGS